MQIKIPATIIVILFFIACSKEDTSNRLNAGSVDYAALRDTAKIPLNDLGTGTFRGSMGGLYPNGANEPSGQYAHALQQSAIPEKSKCGHQEKG